MIDLNDIDALLKAAVECEASDVHLKAGTAPHFRLHGRLMPVEGCEALAVDNMVNYLNQMINSEQREELIKRRDIDIAYSLQGVGRFRCSIFRQRGSIGMIMRLIPTRVKTFSALNLPPVLTKISMERRGLVLCTGTTSSGKSTTLASMIDFINENKICNIITIEDPIEFLHRDKNSLINQREVTVDTESFSLALRSAMRQDPDVILVGEMRDRETIETALLAAETGHLVMSTLHTMDATETVNRIIAIFPPHQQNQIRHQLAAVLKAVISLRLLPNEAGNGRVPATEILVATDQIREYITDKTRTKLIPDAIAAGVTVYGMQTFDQSLFRLYSEGLITYETALHNATRPDDFKLKTDGVNSTADMAKEVMEKFVSGAGSSKKPETAMEEEVSTFIPSKSFSE